MSNNNSNKLDIERENRIPALWRQAFRPFFLAGAVFSILALAAWAAVLSGQWLFTPYANPAFWHAHEMLFGFVAAVIAGFLLTAVQNWTGLRATHGKALILLFALWLLARVLMATGLAAYEWVVIVVDVSFFPAVALLFSRLIIKAGNYRQLPLLAVLALLAAANMLTHCSVIFAKPFLFSWGMYAAVMLVSLLMVVIGGRVIPLFTASGTKTQGVKPLPWLEKTVLVSTWLTALLYITNGAALLPNSALSAIFAIAAFSNAYRALRWRFRVTLSVPLVWSLHLAYWFIPLGFALFALHFIGFNINATTAMHSLTAGAMGSLILAMIARVALGHSGRPLVIHSIMKYAFISMLLAGFIRLVTGLYPALIPTNGYLLSAALWVAAYSIYLTVYFKILISPRADGKPG